MALTIKQTELLPDDYPTIPGNVVLSAAAAVLDPAMIWQRIEGYIAHRWTERAVVWIVEGCGEWVPPLAPATITTIEIWSAGASQWETITPPDQAPLGGYWLPATGPYRFTATVGDDDAPLPANALEAFRRMAEYVAACPDKHGATREELRIGEISQSFNRAASWMANAMQNSGAADLLRNYRSA